MDCKSPAIHRTAVTVAIYAAVYSLMAAIMLIPGFRLLNHGAFRWPYSINGFLITGVGLFLVLERYVWPFFLGSAIHWKKELCIRAGSFVGGTIIFYLLRPGVVPLWEAGYRGMMVCFVVFLLEQLGRLLKPLGGGRWGRLRWSAILVVVPVGLIPVVAALHPVHTVPKRTPAAFGLAFEDVRFETADGLRLAGWLIPHPRPRGNIVFCHGHGRNRGHVAGLLPTLHDLGLNVLAFDFRGHGDSPGHTSTFGRDEVADLVAAEAYLRTRCPNQPVVVAGISLGAAVTLQALPQLSHVRGVWSEGAFARFSNAARYKLALPGPLLDFYYVLGWLDCGFWGPAINPVDKLRDVTIPIYFCHATEDDLVPFTDALTLYAAYGGPKWHWWVEGASHYNVRQRDREEYLRRLRGFLEGCLKPIDGIMASRKEGTQS